jgi:hypothetical protein
MAAMPVPPAPAPVAETVPLSEPARVLNTFLAPRKTFTDLRRSASWWLPFLITVIVSTIFVYVGDQKVGFRKIAENTLQTQPKQAAQLEQLPPDQREAQMRGRTVATKWISYGFFLFILAWDAVVAAVLFATLKFALSADVKYKTVFAVVVFASLPGILKALLASLSLVAGASANSFTFQNPIATNPGYFVDPAAHAVLYSFLTSFDIFTIWTLVLTAIGLTCVTKIKSGTAYAVVFGWFAVAILMGVGAAAIFS